MITASQALFQTQFVDSPRHPFDWGAMNFLVHTPDVVAVVFLPVLPRPLPSSSQKTQVSKKEVFFVIRFLR